MKPTISVLMSVYNGELFLKEAIDSVLEQTFTDFEFIIYDDCSSDSSLELLKEYAKKDARINLKVNEENRGLTANLINGMNIAKGTYLARMDADDICLPERFERQVSYLNNHKEVSLLGSSVVFFDNSNYDFIGYQPIDHETIKVELLLGYTMMHPSVMMRLNDFRKHNLNYDISYRYSQDFDLWVRAIKVLKFANLREPLLKMREHIAKISRTLKPEQKLLSDQVRNNQLASLGVNYSEKEISAFHLRCSQIGLTNVIQLEAYEKILQNILIRNKICREFNHAILKKKIQELFYEFCNSELKSGNAIGLYFWKSSFLKNSYLKPGLLFRIIFRSFLFNFRS